VGGGLVGGLPGAAAGGAAGFGGSSMVQQYGQNLIEFMSARGVDVSNPAAVDAALSTPDFLRQALEYAGTKTQISAGAEGLAGALGGQMLLPRGLIGNALGREAANVLVAQPLAQGVIGAAGDA